MWSSLKGRRKITMGRWNKKKKNLHDVEEGGKEADKKETKEGDENKYT